MNADRPAQIPMPFRLLAMLSLALAAACATSSTSTSTEPNTNTTTPPAGCATGPSLVGQVVTGITNASVCLSAGASYMIAPFYGSKISSAKVGLRVTGTGVVATTSSSASTLLSDVVDGSGFASAASRARSRLDASMRAAERELAPMMPEARRARSSGALFNAIPSTLTVGQTLQLNVEHDNSCANPTYHTGRVAAITSRAIVIADQTNPTGGYTDAEYQSLAVTFDTLVYPMDVRYFGEPSDIDNNGKIVLFFTKAVNDLTPSGSESFIGGFFHPRDLFPTTQTQQLDGCAGSNVGEMFYLMVPDPNRGTNFSKASVANIAVGTIAHEFQHLINSARRLYVNTTAEDFEEVWLNEGLSHIAEELLFYESSKLSPRQNITVTLLRASTRSLDAFNKFQLDNFGRFITYLRAPSSFSPISSNDSLETRGAGWNFLRYVADHVTLTEQTLWFQLVNSTRTGVDNLQAVVGADPTPLMRDWATSVYADDMAGVGSTWQNLSWNLRDIVSALNNANPYPLATLPLGSSTPLDLSIVAGAAAYLTTSVPAGGTGSVSWGTLPTGVTISVMRTK